MHIATSIKQKACEGLLHFRSHYSIAKELGISKGYNNKRPCSVIGNMTPNEYKGKFLEYQKLTC